MCVTAADGKFPATLGFMGLCACGITLYYGLSDGRRSLANQCTAPGARICKLSQDVAGGAARFAAFPHCKQRPEAIHTCWQIIRVRLFLAHGDGASLPLWLSALQRGRPRAQRRRHGLIRESGTHSHAQRPMCFLVERAHATRGFVVFPAILTSTGFRSEPLSRLPLHFVAPVALGLFCLLACLAVATRLCRQIQISLPGVDGFLSPL